MRSYNLLKCHSLGAARAPVWGFIFFFIALFAFLSVASNLSAEPIVADLQPDPYVEGNFIDPNPNGYTISEVIAAGGIIIGDKLFDAFSVTATASPGALAPGVDEIALTPVQIAGDYGMIFNGGWSAGAGQIVDSTIRFRATIQEPGYFFKDNKLYITAPGQSNTTGGIVSVSETVWSQHPSIPDQIPVASKYVYYRSMDDMDLYDYAEFVPLTQVWIIKDVVANGGEGTIGSVHLSEFYQTFSQIPEPSSLALLGFGAFGLAAYAWRKRR